MFVQRQHYMDTWVSDVTQLLSYAPHVCNVQVHIIYQAPQRENKTEKQVEIMTHYSETVENNDGKID